MSLTPGTRIGPYEIDVQIGVGGMGEVYRAVDKNLKRAVAIKVLPASVSTDADRLSRFQREAEVLAALNHPNIAAIFGLERSDGITALAMELVDGPTLADRIGQGTIPLDEALSIARQIAEALESAHERGIIHRDLKPANIKLRPDGSVKVLDFGLAKAMEPAVSGVSSLTASPTLTSPAMTQLGVILGTAAYMSPEQARGIQVDHRADVFSFGVVLYEMLAGTQAFVGESVSDTLASVLKLEPDWNAVSSATPAPIRTLLRRCLTKDRKQRLQAIGEARITLEAVINGGQIAEPTTPPAFRRSDIQWAGWIAVAVLVAVGSLALWGWLRPRSTPSLDVTRLTAAVPVDTNTYGALALSPDGSQLAFVGGPTRQIHLRRMDQFDARALAGTDGASWLSFSPDGKSIGFITGEGGRRADEGRLKRVAVNGGPAQTLANAASVIGPPILSWTPDGEILFTNEGVVMKVRGDGGTPETLAAPDARRGERFLSGPQVLPDGRHILITGSPIARQGAAAPYRVLALDIRTKALTGTLLEAASFAQYVPTSPVAGHLVYYDRSTASLLAAPFDPQRMEVKGTAAPVMEGIQPVGTVGGPFGLFAISPSGALVYAAGAAPGSGSSLVWVDRNGTEEALPAPLRKYNSGARLSPDGRRAAVTIAFDREDVWVYDIARGTLDRITSDGNNGNPVWTPDGKRLIYERRPAGPPAIVSVAADGSGQPVVLTTGDKGPIVPASVTAEGDIVGWNALEGGLWLMSPSGARGDAERRPFFDSATKRFNPQLSPDGKWLAYRSEETGRAEVYVSPFPGPGGRFLISAEGGSFPRWSRDGRELFYRNRTKMMAVDIQTTPEFRAGTPKLLFEGNYTNSYDVDPDGKRFLMIKPPTIQQRAIDQVNVVLNWFTELQQRVPTK